MIFKMASIIRKGIKQVYHVGTLPNQLNISNYVGISFMVPTLQNCHGMSWDFLDSHGILLEPYMHIYLC